MGSRAMRGVLLTLCTFLAQQALIPVQAAADCLPDAVPEDQRKNILANGAQVPLGIWEFTWESASMTGRLFQILATEKLGYNGILQGGTDNVPQGLYAVASCAAPLNMTNPQCDRGDDSYVPTTHAVIEWWPPSLQGEMEHRHWFDANLPDQAPVFLGFMGYTGGESMSVHESTVISALDATGMHLQSYWAYNSSWFQQWTYFDNLSAIPPSRLKQCTSWRNYCDGVNERLARDYKDTTGFEVRNGDTCLVCLDENGDGGKWWPSPACRAQPDKCIPLLTAGEGWLIEDFMEKVLAYNMPFAMGVAATWDDFLWGFRNNNIVTYDWTPGTHYGTLQPKQLVFPRHNASEFKKNIRKTMDLETKLENLAWIGLEQSAPSVFMLGQNFEVTETDMNNMIQYYLALGTASAAACEWIKNNEDTWKHWLPDATQCSSGYGMVDAGDRFTDNRTLAIKCIPCPAGLKSRRLVGGPSMTYTCEPCEAGTFQSMWGKDFCESCGLGYYQNFTGQSQCSRCPRGTFADSPGLPLCHICPTGHTTEGTGFTSEGACECPPGTYCDAGGGPGGGLCVACSEGATCRGFGAAPEANQGFHLAEVTADGLSVFECFKDRLRCPGGPVGTCAPGREGVGCATCQPQMAPAAGGSCEKCEGSDRGPFVVAVIGFFLMLGSVYIKTSMANAEQQSQSLIMSVLTVTQVISVAQLLGVSYKMSVTWQPPISSLLTLLRVFNFDIQVLRMDCVGNFDVLSTYALTLLIAPIAMTALLVVHIMRVLLLHKGRFEDRHHALLGSIGLLLMGFFITISTTILSPFQCEKHPNSQWTLVQYEAQMCWQGGDHVTMMLLGGFALVMPVSFVGLITHLLHLFPHKMSIGDVKFLNTYAFLFLRVKPSTRWFMLVYLLRNLLIAFIPSIPNAFWQVTLMEVMFAATAIFTAYMQPWRLDIVNFLEVLTSAFLLLLMCISSFFVTAVDIQGVATVGLVVALVCIFAFPLVLVAVALRHVFRSKSFHFFLCHHKAAAGSFARLLKMVLMEQRGVKGGIFLDSDNLVDLDKLFNCVAQEVHTLAVLATREIFLRPWCLGEVATAHICKLNVYPIYFGDFQLPDRDFIDNVESRVDLTVLSENGVGIQTVRKALASFTDHKYVTVALTLEAGPMEALVAQMLQKGAGPSKKELSRKGTSEAGIKRFILADGENTEAVAAAIIMTKLLRPLSGGRAQDVPAICEGWPFEAGFGEPINVAVLILMCSSSCFARAKFLQGLTWAMDRGASKVLPVAVADTFQFPTELFYKSLEDSSARLCKLAGTEVVRDLLTKYVEGIFRKIAVALSTMSSSRVLESQAAMVWNRLQGKEAPVAWAVPPAHKSAARAIISSQLSEDLSPRTLELQVDRPAISVVTNL